MDKALKILILEDSDEDVFLIERELKRGGIDFVASVANKEEEFRQALYEIKPDVILADHSLPQFNSIEALKIYHQFRSDEKIHIPFILVTGSVSEEFAAQCIKAGADDYILKDRLKRLPAAIHSALEKTRLESDRMRSHDQLVSSEAMMREAEQLAHFGSWQVDLVTRKHKWSDETYRIFGYEPGAIEVTYDVLLDHVHPEDKQSMLNVIEEAHQLRPTHPCEFRLVDKKGNVKHILSNILVKRNQDQQPVQLLGFNQDVTHERMQSQALARQNRQLIEIAWIQSHQVRGPLARLMGLVNIIESGAEGKFLTDLVEPILESAHELDSIIRRIVRKTEAIEGPEYGKQL